MQITGDKNPIQLIFMSIFVGLITALITVLEEITLTIIRGAFIMCSIIGTLTEPAISQLLAGLSRLEYRSYNASVIAVLNNHQLQTLKAQGSLDSLKHMLSECPLDGSALTAGVPAPVIKLIEGEHND